MGGTRKLNLGDFHSKCLLYLHEKHISSRYVRHEGLEREHFKKSLTDPAKQSNRLKPQVFFHYLSKIPPKKKEKNTSGDANIAMPIRKDMSQDTNVSNALTKQLYVLTYVSINMTCT